VIAASCFEVKSDSNFNEKTFQLKSKSFSFSGQKKYIQIPALQTPRQYLTCNDNTSSPAIHLVSFFLFFIVMSKLNQLQVNYVISNAAFITVISKDIISKIFCKYCHSVLLQNFLLRHYRLVYL
jgi:hypothetical protein